MKRKTAGCLILLVVIIGGIGAVLYPAISGALLMANSLKQGNNGKQIYLAVFDEAITAEAMGIKESIWPVEGQYKTSTDFFRAIVTNGILEEVDFSFFGAPGVKSPKDPNDPEQFLAENNAWCVVLQPNDGLSYDDHNIPASTPFLFTKNIGFGSPLGAPKAGNTIADMTGLRKGVKPFGDKVGIVVTFGGAVMVWPGKYVTQTNFNPKGEKLQFLMP